MALHRTFFPRRPLADLLLVPCLLSAAWGAEIVLSTISQVVVPQVRYFSFPTSPGYGHLSGAFPSVIPSFAALYGTLLCWCGHSQDSRVIACFSIEVDLTMPSFIIFRFAQLACATSISILLILFPNITLFLLIRAHSSSVSPILLLLCPFFVPSFLTIDKISFTPPPSVDGLIGPSNHWYPQIPSGLSYQMDVVHAPPLFSCWLCHEKME